MLSYVSNTLTATSSRGFARELAPMRPTSSAHKSRRYTIDASVTPGAFPQERDYLHVQYHAMEEDFEPPLKPQPQHVRPAESRLSSRQTEEPTRRQLRLPLPDPLRYRDLHRWGKVAPPPNTDLYFCIDMGSAGLTNNEFRGIIEASGLDSWYPDTVLDTALCLLSKYYDCEANGIAIVDTTSVQCIRWAASDDENLNSLSAYKSMLEDKKWIFIPLNTGMEATSADVFQGSHWSLLAIDRPHKRAHYVDGYNYTRSNPDWLRMASDVSIAVGRILGETYARANQWDVPDQFKDNQSGNIDNGPCGPYVVKMVDYYIRRILDHQDSGTEDTINLKLDYHVKDYFKEHFDSTRERWWLLYTVAGVKASQVANARAMEHEQAALGSVPSTWQPAPMFYDSVMFTGDSFTDRQEQKHRELCNAAERRDRWLKDSETSSSPGGILLAPDTEKSSPRSVHIDLDNGIELIDTEMDCDSQGHARRDSLQRTVSPIASGDVLTEGTCSEEVVVPTEEASLTRSEDKSDWTSIDEF